MRRGKCDCGDDDKEDRSMALMADPASAMFPAAGGSSNHSLVNQGGDRLAIKVKCSDNALFKVRPVFAFVEPGAATPLEITRSSGAAKEDYMIVQYATVPAEEQDPANPFRQPGQFQECRIDLAVQ